MNLSVGHRIPLVNRSYCRKNLHATNDTARLSQTSDSFRKAYSPSGMWASHPQRMFC